MGQRAILSNNTARSIKIMRYELGVTQSQLAGAIGVATSTIKTWESGRAMPSPKHYKYIHDFLWGDSIDIDVDKINQIEKRLEAAREQDIKTAELARIKPEDIPPMVAR